MSKRFNRSKVRLEPGRRGPLHHVRGRFNRSKVRLEHDPVGGQAHRFDVDRSGGWGALLETFLEGVANERGLADAVGAREEDVAGTIVRDGGIERAAERVDGAVPVLEALRDVLTGKDIWIRQHVRTVANEGT